MSKIRHFLVLIIICSPELQTCDTQCLEDAGYYILRTLLGHAKSVAYEDLLKIANTVYLTYKIEE